ARPPSWAQRPASVRTDAATAPHRRPHHTDDHPGGCPRPRARAWGMSRNLVLTIFQRPGCHILVYRKGGQASVAFVQDDALVRAWLDAGGEGELVPPAVAVGGDSASSGYAGGVVLAPGAVGARGVRAGL